MPLTSAVSAPDRIFGWSHMVLKSIGRPSSVISFGPPLRAYSPPSSPTTPITAARCMACLRVPGLKMTTATTTSRSTPRAAGMRAVMLACFGDLAVGAGVLGSVFFASS